MSSNGVNLLDVAYESLGYAQGELFDSSDSPSGLSERDWVSKGEWLTLAKRAGVEKVFFVEDSPVIVFARADSPNPTVLREFFNRVWCMARPHLLFLATPAELLVYDLNSQPVRTDTEWNSEERCLHTIRSAAEVQSALHRYRSEQVQSGALYDSFDTTTPSHRADQLFIRDLKAIREALLKDPNLPAPVANALIGRSIFIRYLEDRGVLDKEYFYAISENNPKWAEHLLERNGTPDINPEMENKLYAKVLSNKDFTFALFDQLAEDFNGDVFLSSNDEISIVSQKHLSLLQKLLYGVADEQLNLFFFAYKFDVIPIDLISSMYEEFYNVDKNKGDNNGSFYTPSALVEFSLAQVLTIEKLSNGPRILDPACGSGIFLVEAFRRIVRYNWHKNKRPLTRAELLSILRQQITGIDVNAEAVRIAAFSLYLALLHYQSPPSIRAHKKLPHLILSAGQQDDPENHYSILITSNAFSTETVIETNESIPLLKSDSVDIVVGNPPWGAGSKSEAGAVLAWCRRRNLTVGDRELSQAFIHRAIDFLRPGGSCCLLVSSGVCFKRSPKSQSFRRQWLSSSSLKSVFNFAHVRNTFFSNSKRVNKSIAPFVLVVFEKSVVADNIVQYWTAKNSRASMILRTVRLSKADLALVHQRELLADERLWKIFWWGSHRDLALIQALDLETPLEDAAIDGSLLVQDIGTGFLEGKAGTKPRPELASFKELPVTHFTSYGNLKKQVLASPPSRIRRLGNLDYYSGLRILVKRGISQEGGANGRIVARLASTPFCFRHSIYCLKIASRSKEEAMLILGILWSSLARYYIFMTSGSWGMWHHELYEETIRRIPIRLPKVGRLRTDLLNIVRRLSNVVLNRLTLGNQDGGNEVSLLENRLDEVVFSIYDLSDAERDQIRDLCEIGLDHFYRSSDSIAVKPLAIPPLKIGRVGQIPAARDQRSFSLHSYIEAFLGIWNPELAPAGEFVWRIFSSPGDEMIAVLFSTASLDTIRATDDTYALEWTHILGRISQHLALPFSSKTIFVEGMIRVVSDTDIVILKKNELRLWTRSQARLDADATLLQAVHLQERSSR